MKMRYIKIPVHELTELDERTQEHVITHWRDNDYFHWGDEWRATLDAFAAKFSAVATIRNWEVSTWRHSFIDVGYSDTAEVFGWRNELSGVRLWKWLQAEFGITHTEATGHCELTGVFCDDDIMKPLYDFIKSPDTHSTLECLLETCFGSWLRGYEADLEYWESEQAIREDILERGIVFYKDGRACSCDPLPPAWPIACRQHVRNRYHRLKSRLRRQLSLLTT